LRSMTGETVTSPDALRAELDDVRATGIGVEQDEAVIGESSIASPVFDSWGAVVGAIGVVVPSGGSVREHEAREAVRETARALSRELGAESWPPRPPG
jgi:DNA-binding IclR family transcriptional regulator